MAEGFFSPVKKSAPPAGGEGILSVTEVTKRIKYLIEGNFPPLWISGEISNLKRPSSGHVYFTLKDSQSQIAAVMFRRDAEKLRFDPEDGLEVVACGRITVYEVRGIYQLMASRMEPKGYGSLQLAFEQLKRKLHKEGLFDASAKKPIPFLPVRIGLVTSRTGAAIQDLIKVITRRFPPVSLLLYPVRVQGEGAGLEIAQAIDELNRMGGIDVLVVGRGGGSLEDLWPFNEEVVARAIFRSKIPVISAVGHEIDLTISDLVADRRALTPSEAGELVVPRLEDLLGQLNGCRSRLHGALKGKLEALRTRVEAIRNRYAFRIPLEKFRKHQQELDSLSERLTESQRFKVNASRERLGFLRGKLDSLGPYSVLKRGYSITLLKDGEGVVSGVSQLELYAKVKTILYRGSFVAEVQEMEEGGLGSAPEAFLEEPDEPNEKRREEL